MKNLGKRVRDLFARRGLASLFWLISEKVLQLGFSAVSVGLIARSLGVAQFGEFQYVLSVLFVFSAIGLMAGSEVAAPRLVENTDPGARKQLLGSLLAVRLIVGGLACVAMMIWAIFSESASRQPLMFIMALSLLVAEPFNVLRLIREVGQNTRIITTIRLLSSCAKLAIIALLYVLEAPLITFVIVYSAEYFLVAVAYLYTIRDDGMPWQWRASLDVMRRFLQKGFFVWLGVLSMILIQRLDRLVLEGRLSADIYGQYTAALGLLDSAWFFGPVAIAALAPSLVYHESAVQRGTPIRRFLPSIILMGIAVAIAIALFAPFVIPIIFGVQFDQAVHIMQAAALILIPGFAALSLDAILIKGGMHRAVTFKWMAGLATAALLLWPDLGWSWRQGPIAIGAGYTISFLAGAFVLAQASRRTKGSLLQ